MAEGITFCDEMGNGYGWIVDKPELLQRASHALAAAGRVEVVPRAEVGGLELVAAAQGQARERSRSHDGRGADDQLAATDPTTLRHV